MKRSGSDTTYLIATRSRDKVREIGEIAAQGPRVALIGLEQAGVLAREEEDSVEIHETFIGNAIAKARYFMQRTGLAAIADDSGLCVDSLGGAPGVRSRRYAHDEPARGLSADEANNARLLERLAAVPPEERTARYVCAACAVHPRGDIVVAMGSVVGRIGFEARGSGGFGYDPLFELPALGLSFAQLDAAEKHRISHRGRAFRALLAQLDP